jgi:MHS family proline/betaine transporter-like MFS transporter
MDLSITSIIYGVSLMILSNRLPKEVWIGWVSSLVEAYNMAIYSFMAPLLAKLIFKQGEGSAIFFSYALVFIGSCFLYPAGAIYYGFIGDKKGRRKTCIYSTLGLAIATGMMGLVPIQYLSESSWICFLVLIGAQHFFSGGEYHGSIVFSLEHSGFKRGGMMSSLSCLFAVFGLVAANGLAALAYLGDLGMRVCFFAGGVGGLISYLLKNHCQETPAFAALSQESLEGVEWFAFIKSEWRKIVTVIAVLAFFIVSYTFIFVFLPLMHFDQTAVKNFDTFKSLMAYGLLLVAAGWAADRAGIQKVMLIGISLFSLAIVPVCSFSTDLLAAQMVLTACACLAIGPIHSWMLHQFEVKNRCRGIFISSAVAASLFGGSTVPVCLMIFERAHSLTMCCMYPLTIALGAFASLVFCKKTKEILEFV